MGTRAIDTQGRQRIDVRLDFRDPKTMRLIASERIDCAGWCFEVEALEGRRIDRVQAFPDAGAEDLAP